MPSSFRPLIIGAQYPALERGLTADTLAVHSFDATPYTVCTSHIVAGHGTVTDVLEVPSDTVSAQLEHIFATQSPNAAKVGVVGSPASADVIFRSLKSNLEGPVVLDLTLSGPSGEDIVDPDTLDVITQHLGEMDLVSASVTDATLLAGMKIPSLDDAQVAAQRLGQRGGRHVLLRCGRLATHHFDTESDPPNYAVDLYFDGEELAVFEAPFIDDIEHLSGRASGFMISVLHSLWSGRSVLHALQSSKAVVTEALRKAASAPEDASAASTYFGALHHRVLQEVVDEA